jgi:pilus assembly protein FimV
MFLPFASHALGLGKLVVRSALNEPLNAEIEFTSVTDKELKGLQVGLAPRSDFDAAGVDRLAFLGKIKFIVSKRADGEYFVQLRTDQVIEEPFLHMLLAVEWPGGRMVREYTALIDPPTQMAGKPDAVDAPEASASADAAPPVESEQLSDGKPWPQLPPEEETVAVAPATPEEQPQSQPQPDAQDGTPAWAAPPLDPKLLEPQTAEPMDSQPTVEPLAPATVSVDSEPVVEPLAPSNSSAESESTPDVSPEPTTTTASAEKSAVVSNAAVGDAYKVKRGDTAWRIAEQLRVGNNHTIEQVVLALYRANPKAFFDSNVNNLKAGHILKVPESTQIEATTPVKARTQFRAQYDAWQEYKIKLAGASSAIKVVETAPSTTPAPAVTPTVKEPAKQPVKEPAKEPAKTETTTTVAKDPQSKEELLKIVRSTIQGEKTTPDKKPAEGETQKDTTSKEHATLAGRVATLEESLTSRALENKELSDKVAQVRAQLKRESRLIQIEQPDLAKTQDKLKGSTPAPVVNAPPVIAKVEPTPTPKVEAPVSTPKVTETPKVVTPAPETPKTVTPVPTPKKRVVPPPAPVEEKGFVSDLVDSVLGGDMVMPLIIGLVGLLSLGIGVVYFNRRRKSIAEFEESILQSEGIPGNTGEPAVTSDTSGQVVSTGDTSFLSDFSQGGMGNIHTDEVDPIAEAEVYLAYGRDETAEEILKEAMVKNPAREELKLKLLEIYANRSDVRAFETLAEEMYAAMGGRPSKHWPRVSELGRKLNPDNPMFRAGAGASAGGSNPNFADTARMKATMPPVTTLMGGDSATGQIPTATAPVGGSDFDFDLGDATASAAPAADQGIDFDFASDTSNVKSEPESLDFGKADMDLGSSDSGMEMPVSGGGNNVVDFDFGEKEESLTGVPETEIAVADDLGLSSASLDAAPVSDSGEAPQWDETATKLDLARAYIDMGDSEGARSILDEVMAEGNEQQQKQAKELAAQLG